jgi:hypothetical protein
MYEIETPDIYSFLKEEINHMMDLSNYPEPDMTNHKIIGKFKDETAGAPIEEFVGLRAKCYAYKVNQAAIMKCKGIKKAAIQKELNLELYKSILFGKKTDVHKLTYDNIRSYKHNIYSEKITKVALNKNDNKCLVLDDDVNTHAHGYIEPDGQADITASKKQKIITE